jgi:hypothetical protein
MAAAADCRTLRLPPLEAHGPKGTAGMCPSPAQAAYGPDWLEFQPGSPIRSYYTDLPRTQTDDLISDFSHRVLTQQPLRVAGAYATDVLKLFMPVRRTGAGDTPLWRWQFQTHYQYFSPHASPQVVGGAVARYGGGSPAVWRPGASFLRAYQLHGGYTPGPLFALAALAGLAGAVAALVRRRAGPAVRQPALACFLMFTAAVAVLLVSDVFEFSWRYQLPALVTLIPAGALGITAIRPARTARQD